MTIVTKPFRREIKLNKIINKIMIYITLPTNMIFQKLNLRDEAIDCLVDKDDDTRIIRLQPIIKEVLKENTHHPKVIDRGDFIIFLKTPPYDETLYLAYTPNRNGKFPTEKEPYLISGIKANNFRPQNKTRYGEFWNNYASLSKKQEQELLVQRQEQKDNRTKTGDSPNTN